MHVKLLLNKLVNCYVNEIALIDNCNCTLFLWFVFIIIISSPGGSPVRAIVLLSAAAALAKC